MKRIMRATPTGPSTSIILELPDRIQVIGAQEMVMSPLKRSFKQSKMEEVQISISGF